MKLKLEGLGVIALGIGAYLIYRKLFGHDGALDVTSDKNVAYQAADSAAKAVFGPKGTITDIFPWLNSTSAQKTTTSSAILKNAMMPTTFAPYWYNADGTKRTTPMSLWGTVYGTYGEQLQIADKATQAAIPLEDVPT